MASTTFIPNHKTNLRGQLNQAEIHVIGWKSRPDVNLNIQITQYDSLVQYE